MHHSISDLSGFRAADGQEEFLDEDLETPTNPPPSRERRNPAEHRTWADTQQPSDGITEDLDDLLAEAMQQRRVGDAVKAARARAKAGYGNTPEDLERIRRWEAANEWRSVADVALFHRFKCACGKHSTVFEGMMVEQIGRRNPELHRWTAVAEGTQQSDDLPKRTAIRISKVPMCPVCLPEKGFSLADGLEWSI